MIRSLRPRLPLPLVIALGLFVRLAAAEDGEATPLRPEDTPAIEEGDDAAARAEAPPAAPARDWIEVQVELHRRGFSCGSIDGVRGPQTAAALRAFQHNEGLRETGDLDEATAQALAVTAPVLSAHIFTADELAQLRPLPDTWLEKSQQPALGYATALEMAAERYRASPNFLRRLNPGVDWDAVAPGTVIRVPAVGRSDISGQLARIHVRLAEHVLEGMDEAGQIVVHFPVSIARIVEKRPVGELQVTVVIPDPDYTFDPENFPESAEGRQLGRRLLIPPGPNNPVGLAWIGLDRPGYGIHGTPDPEKVGRTESHGCLRLANWDAVTLLRLAWAGLPVVVDP